MSAVGDFFAGLGENINGAIGGAVNIVAGIGNVQQASASMSMAQADVVRSNAATQLELAKQQAQDKDKDRLMLIWGSIILGALLLSFVAVKVFK